MKRNRTLLVIVACLYGAAAVLYLVLYARGFSGFTPGERVIRGLLFVFAAAAGILAVFAWRKMTDRKEAKPKDLSEMTPEELWQLFPIYLVGHKDGWKCQYEKEAARLKELFSGLPPCEISHIGSTSIGKIQAKDIVDLLIEVDHGHGLAPYMERMEKSGVYRLMASDEKSADYNKGYTPYGFAAEVFHLHFRFRGDNDELYFRDYMIDHPQLAQEYEKLKISLWGRFEHNRDAYTEGKGEFIRKYTLLAKEAYPGRYDRQSTEPVPERNAERQEKELQ